ncbi:methyltransferase family protein [Rhizobium sp. HT1-10]|uniref:methyltransferase family protein n=1 Tax=Rhizobium sp. HT1-10 TaxID=3111638 RepID=UPI003C265310
MNAYRAKPLTFPWPPFVYGLFILLALVADQALPAALPRLDWAIFWALGVILTLGAVWLEIWALKTLLESKTTLNPNRRTVHLITRGPFRFSRNPTYLGYTLITIGFALMTGSPWLLVAAFAAAVTTDVVAIRYEELHLLYRFGCEFESYCRQTRRWL